jgi:thiol-disulfide isomerase/thioredoxin
MNDPQVPGGVARARHGATPRHQLRGAGAALAALGLPRWARAAHEVRVWPQGRPAPPLQLSDLDNQAWSLVGLKGRAVMLNFWATWCDPCRAEMPSLQRLAATRQAAGLVVLAVNYKEPVPSIRRFLQDTPIQLPILLDRDGEAAAQWTPRVFPTTVLIDRDGVPRSMVVGELDWMDGTVDALIQPLLARAKAG